VLSTLSIFYVHHYNIRRSICLTDLARFPSPLSPPSHVIGSSYARSMTFVCTNRRRVGEPRSRTCRWFFFLFHLQGIQFSRYKINFFFLITCSISVVYKSHGLYYYINVYIIFIVCKIYEIIRITKVLYRKTLCYCRRTEFQRIKLGMYSVLFSFKSKFVLNYLKVVLIIILKHMSFKCN